MLVAAAVLPHPPLLVPALAAGAAGELDGLRASCAKALDAVLASASTHLIVVAGGGERATLGPGARGSLAGFGVPVEAAVPGATPTGEPVLPLAATIGCWLLDQRTVTCPVSVEVVPERMAPRDAAALGAGLAASHDRVAVVAMGDGSAALTARAPGYLVAGAADWQDEVERLVGAADLAGIGELTVEDAERYRAAGRAAWQVLAGAAAGASWHGALLAAEAPYGVGYVVAAWGRVP